MQPSHDDIFRIIKDAICELNAELDYDHLREVSGDHRAACHLLDERS